MSISLKTRLDLILLCSQWIDYILREHNQLRRETFVFRFASNERKVFDTNKHSINEEIQKRHYKSNIGIQHAFSLNHEQQKKLSTTEQT